MTAHTESRPSANSSPLPAPRGRDKAERSRRARTIALRVVVLCLAAGVALVVWAVWIPLVLAAWCAMLATPLHRRLAARVGGSKAAGVVTVALVLSVLAPLSVIGLSLTGSAVELVRQIRSSSGFGAAVRAVLGSNEAARAVVDGHAGRIVQLLQMHGAEALEVASTVFGAATHMLVVLLVFVVGFYTFMVDGTKAYRWALAYSPLSEQHTRRLFDAFAETGRGLFVGFGLTALVQAVVTAVGFAVLDVPNALVLGTLTGFSSFVPFVGTGLVTVPVTALMFILRGPGVGVGCLVIVVIAGSIDNLLRPVLSRYGQLHLPNFVTFVALIGGLMMFGPSGLVAGPLLMRMSLEALRIWKQESRARTSSTGQLALDLRDEPSKQPDHHSAP